MLTGSIHLYGNPRELYIQEMQELIEEVVLGLVEGRGAETKPADLSDGLVEWLEGSIDPLSALQASTTL